MYLSKEGDTVLVVQGDEIKLRFPIHNLEGIVTCGYTGASPALMRLCCERGVALSFLSSTGRFIGRLTGEVHGNVLVRRTQYRWADNDEKTLSLSKRFVQAKILNSRVALMRCLRDHGGKQDMSEMNSAVNELGRLATKVERLGNLELLRGIEGEAAKKYFNCFNMMITAQKEDFIFCNRNRRPPTDNVNAMLSFVYVLLAREVSSALETVGFDPQVGFLHRDRPGRDSLAFDIMEELRPYLADRLVLSLINRRQIDAKGFIKKESGAVIMDDDTRKTVLTEWQKRKQEELTHPYLEEKLSIGLLPYAQALLLSRYIRGDLEDYPPFFWK